jgi:MFS transporter, AAHS family, benzoate transport protein
VLDGYDMIMYGAVVPSFLSDPVLALQPPQVAAIASWQLIGMLLGALCAGALSDSFGRKRILVLSVVVFSAAMGAGAVADSGATLMASRFVAGLGLAGLMPTISALVMEYCPRRSQAFFFLLMFTGIPIGGAFAALTGLSVITTGGWRPMFWIGAAPAIILLPALIRVVPESVDFLVSHGHTPRAQRLAARLGLPFPPDP